jgi:acyl-CoA reductase-like NAD-dependent aldehyde dehydrogenase
MRSSSLLCVPALLAGCAVLHRPLPPAPMSAPALAPVPAVAAQGAPIETIPFHTGVSSATVERMARERGCTGGPGAGLITAAGPVEVYRMQCGDGKVFMARCELRQCRPM